MFELARKNSVRSAQRKYDGAPYQLIPEPQLYHVTRTRVETFFQHDYPWEEDLDLVSQRGCALGMRLSRRIFTGGSKTDGFTSSKNCEDCLQGEFERTETFCVFFEPPNNVGLWSLSPMAGQRSTRVDNTTIQSRTLRILRLLDLYLPRAAGVLD